MNRILLRNIFSLVTDPMKEQLHDVDLLVEGNVVKEVGKGLAVREGVRVLDCSGCVVVPGFVNTHHHFYQTLTRALPAVQDAKLFDWLKYLYEVWKNLTPDAVYWSSALAMAELAKTGCTCTTDHHYLYPNNFGGDIMSLQFEAADRIGMRFSPTRGSMSLSKKNGGLPPDSVVQSEDEILRDSERCIKTFHDNSTFSMHKIVLAPCSPFSVTKSIMKSSSALAREYGVRLHTHLCETKDEEQQCLDMYGVRPLELMRECDLIGPDTFYAHGIHFNDEELQILKETGTHIAHCPSSNMRLGSGICRVREMLDLGINVGLGVDGAASNDSSDMLGELRSALLLQRIRYGAKGITAKEVFKIAEENGAKMLGYDKIGRLEKGWAADIAVFDVSTIPYAGSASDPMASLIFCGTNHETKYTIINGKIVVDDGHLIAFDEKELASKASAISTQMIKGI